ncbi:MAG: SMP-30/gluconolactonase/LRE family protein [Aestuariivirga sp.]|uniref:SMP-30/gluconolactonase/LRE family protein n=1 Tax=Aestuariivirga sp. TaxID=2650926 RepID=UPI0025BBD934|nr:SMP-30/gluconolactonase/LRE family protein [Aestuariivirga sp.]MCA3561900.1 SMP-30/gluconolactonase/LRE family protein [Aestuariivirga sp.]
MALVPRIVAQTRDRLGESPLWHAGEQAIYWTDLYGPTIHRLREGGAVESWRVPGTKHLGSFVFVSGGWLLLAIDTGLVLFNPTTTAFTPFGDPNEGREGVIYNDSKLDRSGRLWVGTADLAEVAPRGILYCVDASGRPHVGDSGFAVCNGPAFSPDGGTLYFSDSIGRRLIAYDLAPGSSRLRNRRLFVSMGPEDGVPDGLTVDAEGGVWCAHYGAGRLTRFAPDGHVLTTIDVPCPIVTSMGFGGPDMTTLYVTTGWTPGVARAEDEPGPGGALLAYDTGIHGLAEPEFPMPPR